MLLGAAEAGFFPGIIVYFTHWFTNHDRARALAGLVMAIPICLALGAPISAMLLEINWLGLVGWKWLFLLEGLPAVVLGVVTLFVLDDRPRDAKWLEPHERDWISGQLDAEARAENRYLAQVRQQPAKRLGAVAAVLVAIQHRDAPARQAVGDEREPVERAEAAALRVSGVMKTRHGRNGHVPKPSAFHRVSRTAGRASFDWRS